MTLFKSEKSTKWFLILHSACLQIKVITVLLSIKSYYIILVKLLFSTYLQWLLKLALTAILKLIRFVFSLIPTGKHCHCVSYMVNTA